MNFDEIEAITISILDEAHESLGKFDIPIPVEQIVNDLFQLRVEPKELLKGEAGKLILEERAIIVNSKDKTERQRFTISHELGHYCLHKNTFITSKMNINHRKETEANAFGATLLMPGKLVYKSLLRNLTAIDNFETDWLQKVLDLLPQSEYRYFNKLLFSQFFQGMDISNRRKKWAKTLIALIPEIAEEFMVSKEALSVRMQILGLLSPIYKSELSTFTKYNLLI